MEIQRAICDFPLLILSPTLPSTGKVLLPGLAGDALDTAQRFVLILANLNNHWDRIVRQGEMRRAII